MDDGIPKIYETKEVESKWYGWWEERGYFHPEPNPDQPYYSVTIPPPNVTGSLHMGHALNHSIIDALIRWNRMKGLNTLCLPGTDHAGIATQNVVEKELRKDHTSRYDLGREKFIERIWEWVDVYGSTIINQLKSLGCSYDWQRLRFTLDKDYADAVLEVFVRWWNDERLYLGSRVVNWCPRCRTVISDIEVANEERNGFLWHIRYPFEDGTGYVTVATTRPETMLGDVAVAVNPEDTRYKHLVGKTLRLPLVNRSIPLVPDPYPDPEFGSGAVKITPSHDPNDFEVGKRHNLQMPVVIAKDATIDTRALLAELGQEENETLLSYQGLDRYEARERIVEDLKKLGLLDKVEPHKLAIGICDRCHTVIEPLLSEQWFANMADIAKPAIDVVKEGRIRFIPDRYVGVYLNWMENIRDWPISRQLWWGHQIPAYYCVSCHLEDFEKIDGEWDILRRRDPIVSKTTPEKCPRCGGSELVRDPWVLDTWFSSAIWPQTTFGWPNDTPELRNYYPTCTMTTAQEIIFLWVARMIMTGLYFMKEIPFKDVYIHATVLDAQGRRMSKSKGTGIDPLDLIEKFGTDATRFALLQQAGLNQDIRFSEQRVEIARNFCNKIWNASRFVMMNLDEGFYGEYKHELPAQSEMEEIDRWIVSRLQRVVQNIHESLSEYRMDDAARALYEFFWNEFCDWYIEAVKPRLMDDDRKRIPQTVLTYVLERSLRLIHPFMPFITEEIWQAIPHEGESVMLASYPTFDESRLDENAEAAINLLMDVTRAVRNLRAEIGITPGQKVSTVYVQPTREGSGEIIERGAALIRTFAWLDDLTINTPAEEIKRIESTVVGADVFLPIEGVIDTEKECARLRKEMDKVEADLNRIRAKLRTPQFLDRAPAEVVEKERALDKELTERLTKISERMKTFGG